jgi:hypothetical protein
MSAHSNDDKEWTFTIDLKELTTKSRLPVETTKAERTSVYALPKLELEETRKGEPTRLIKVRDALDGRDRVSSIRMKILAFAIIMFFAVMFVFKR